MAAKKKQTKTKTVKAGGQRRQAEQWEARASMHLLLDRIAYALEEIARVNHKSLEIQREMREDSKNLHDWCRASFLITAEERGFVIEENLEGTAIASDMADSEWREYMRRQIQLRELRHQEEDTHAEAQRAARKAAKPAGES